MNTIMNTVEPAVGYIRVSNEELQGNNFSLPEQTHSLKEYAAFHEYLLTKIFEDKDTGSELDRESLEELLEYIELHKIKVVIVYRFDRLGRGEVQAIAKYLIAQRGARVESATESNEDTPEGRAMRGMMSVFSGYERETIIKRTKDGRKSRARSGNVLLSSPPYGYKIIRPSDKQTYLEIDEKEGPIVVLIFRWYAYGDENGKMLSIAEICRQLTKMGVPTRGDISPHFVKESGRGTWLSSVVSRILRKTAYMGEWQYNEYTTVGKRKLTKSKRSGKKYRPHILKKTEAKERVAVKVPAIVDEATFYAVQRRISNNLPRNGGAGRPAKHFHLLRGLIRCGHCNYAMHGNHDPKGSWSEYRCSGKRHHKGCPLPGFNGKRLEAKVWEWLAELCRNPDRIDGLIEGRKADADKRHKQELATIKHIEQMIAEKQRARESIKALHAAQAITTEEAAIDLKRIAAEIGELEVQRDKAMSRVKGDVYTDDQIATIKEAFRALGRLSTAPLSPQQRRRTLELLEVKIRCYYEDERRYAHVECLIDHKRIAIAGRGEPESGNGDQDIAADMGVSAISWCCS